MFNRGLFQETLEIALDDDNPARVEQLLLRIDTATGIYQDPASLEKDDKTLAAKPRNLLKIAIEAGAFNVAKWQLEEYYGAHSTRETDSSASTAITPAPVAQAAAATSASNTTRADTIPANTPPSSPGQPKTPTTPPSATGSLPRTSPNPPTRTPPALAATATALSTPRSPRTTSTTAPTPATTRRPRPLATHHHLLAALTTADPTLTLPFLDLLHTHEPRLIHARFHDPPAASALAAARTDTLTDALALAAMDARADVVAWLCARGADPAASSFAARPLTGWLTGGLAAEPAPGRDGVGLFDRGVARVLLAAGTDFGEDQGLVERVCGLSDEVWEKAIRERGVWDYHGRRPRSGLGKIYS
ncbi:hypothetical protein GTA08_BOTSDO00150 [Neofusicoccum parvum]|uniref:Uncharacterized protein n=1 Tax=Neofusicoccum parvum TaxID=310453 RepID=A0ACB5S2S3_9PEZI|nr:hypothetical protein GTA08_BOTSDO00150 [Neofusicoccum parvum]